MSDQATNERAVGDHIQLGVVEIARLSPTSTSEELLRRIATLLFMLVAGLLTVFAYYASSLCITVVLAFLAILFDPVVVLLERLRLHRGVAAAVVVLAAIALFGVLGHNLYGRATNFAEELPCIPRSFSKPLSQLAPISNRT
jgi:predicted PurR-regulated permease PerM